MAFSICLHSRHLISKVMDDARSVDEYCFERIRIKREEPFFISQSDMVGLLQSTISNDPLIFGGGVIRKRKHESMVSKNLPALHSGRSFQNISPLLISPRSLKYLIDSFQ